MSPRIAGLADDFKEQKSEVDDHNAQFEYFRIYFDGPYLISVPVVKQEEDTKAESDGEGNNIIMDNTWQNKHDNKHSPIKQAFHK